MNTIYCPICEHPCKETAKTCGSCGHVLAAEPEPEPPPTPIEPLFGATRYGARTFGGLSHGESGQILREFLALGLRIVGWIAIAFSVFYLSQSGSNTAAQGGAIAVCAMGFICIAIADIWLACVASAYSLHRIAERMRNDLVERDEVK